MKINSENLWKYVNELATGEKVTFGVYYDDQYVTEILWNGDNFEWESGRFNSEAFFNPLYDFVVIRNNEDNKLLKETSRLYSGYDREKAIRDEYDFINDFKMEEDNKIEKIDDFVGTTDNEFMYNIRQIKDKINEIIEVLNEE